MTTDATPETGPRLAVRMPRHRMPLVVAAVLVVAVTAVLFFTVWAPQEKARVVTGWRERLTAMADDRTAAVEEWVRERVGDATVLASNPAVVAFLSGQAAGCPASVLPAEREARLRAVLSTVARSYQYRSVHLLDPSLAQVTGVGAGPSAGCREVAARALASDAPVVDLCLQGGGVAVAATAAAVRAPASGSSAAGPVVGVVLLGVEAGDWLYPLLHSEPFPTRTGESLLVGRDRASFVFLSPLRNATHPPLSLRVPLDTPGLPAAKALAGKEVCELCVDYRGVRVLAVTRSLRAAPWGLVVKVDEAEVLAGYRSWLRETLFTGTACTVVLLLIGVLLARARRAQVEATLARGQARLSLLLDHANDAIVFLALDGTIREVNRRAEELYGISRRELMMGRTLADLCPPDARESAWADLERAKHTGRLVFETTTQRADGALIPVEVSIRRATLDGEELLVVIVRDVTERKRTEEALQETEREWRELVENLNDLIYRVSMEGVITYVSPVVTRVMGFSPEEVVGRRYSELVHPEDLDAILGAFDDVLEYRVSPSEYRFLNKQGQTRWVRTSSRPVVENGHVVGLQGVLTDITERKQAEQALRESEERHRALLDHAGIGVGYWDLQGRVLLLNRHAATVLGGNPADYVGMSMSELFGEKVGGLYLARIREVARDGVTREYEDTVPLPAGERSFLSVFSRVLDVRGEVEGVQILSHNITDRKLAEAERERLLSRLRSLTVRMADAEEEQRKRLARELHDKVGQNLTALALDLSIVQSQLPAAALEVVGPRLEDGAALLEQTVRQLRDVMTELRPPALDEVGLLAALRWYGDQLSARTGLTVSVEGDEPPVRLAPAVEIALFRMVQEALTNVAKHASARRASVRLAVTADRLAVAVEDDGVGFDPARTSAAGGSAGWGLVGMRERAEGVGGSIRVDSKPGEGTCVTITVPR